jgi:hypothetical protein
MNARPVPPRAMLCFVASTAACSRNILGSRAEYPPLLALNNGELVIDKEGPWESEYYLSEKCNASNLRSAKVCAFEAIKIARSKLGF